MKYIFLVLSLTGFTLGTFTSCSDGWLAYEGSCYFFGHDEVHFTEAEHYCRQRNGHLIHVNSKAENDFIKDRLTDLNHHYWWMGLTDEVTEGKWQWFGTDEPATFTDWYPGQPNLAVEDCAIFYDAYGYQWGDIPCTRTCIAICEASGGHDCEIIG
ncbi:perlucin-like protein isoform X2 [Mercenaria mercenaria]|uniref:perlucin-like protein isoform X2 n=1 Tax=Mercenaria mercenaria TaxID=6596 RepID=UPI00234F58E5|nr:perlucin-like protein isoform X2 [Mercenaria mercenaria]